MNKKIIKYRNDILKDDTTGHSIDHIDRVVKLAKKILETEPQADIELTLTAANLHDVIDEKVVKNVEEAKNNLREFLKEMRLSEEDITKIFFIIENMSYSKNLEGHIELPIEGKIVQDADRLDAIGAIGIARTFYYGGSKKNKMYDNNEKPRKDLNHDEYRNESTVVNHFYEKLLNLKDLMNTSEGKRLAIARHNFMKEFLKEFKLEI